MKHSGHACVSAAIINDVYRLGSLLPLTVASRVHQTQRVQNWQTPLYASGKIPVFPYYCAMFHQVLAIPEPGHKQAIGLCYFCVESKTVFRARKTMQNIETRK